MPLYVAFCITVSEIQTQPGCRRSDTFRRTSIRDAHLKRKIPLSNRHLPHSICRMCSDTLFYQKLWSRLLFSSLAIDSIPSRSNAPIARGLSIGLENHAADLQLCTPWLRQKPSCCSASKLALSFLRGRFKVGSLFNLNHSGATLALDRGLVHFRGDAAPHLF